MFDLLEIGQSSKVRPRGRSQYCKQRLESIGVKDNDGGVLEAYTVPSTEK